MESTREFDRETHRVIVLAQGGNKLLLAPAGDRVLLPSVEIPRWQRVAENLTAAMRNEWGQEVICLFTQHDGVVSGSANGHNYQVTQSYEAVAQSSPRAEWATIGSLSEENFADPADYWVSRRALAECLTPAGGETEQPFAQLGWFGELQAWVESVTAPMGLQVTGRFLQLNASPTFSLVRFETSGPAVWFKAVGEPNVHECPITLALARLFPQYLPTIVANRSEWNGWLALEAEGTNLGETKAFQSWETAATALATLQLQSTANTGSLVEAGARELPCFVLSNLVRPFFSLMAQLMEMQPKAPPSVLSQGDLQLLGDQIQESLSSLEEFHLPDALGHLDLNPGNVIVSESHCVFLDWAEAYVGNPFLSFQYLREHFRRVTGTENGTEAELTAAYATPWLSVISSDRLEEALSLAPLIAVFAYAAATPGWRDEARLRDPKFAAYLRSLTRRMHREANKLMGRRSPCLN